MKRRTKNPNQISFIFDEDLFPTSFPTSHSPSSPVLFDDLSKQFLSYYRSARGVVRGEVVRANLERYLPASRQSQVLDLGCGQGLDTVWLARHGYMVSAVDPSLRMLDAARATAIAQLSPTQLERIHFEIGDDLSSLESHGDGVFDLILCHGVIMYQDDDERFLRNLCRLLRPGGRLSLLTKNAAALAYRSAADGQFSEAEALIVRPDTSVGRLGVQTRAHSVMKLSELLASNDVNIEDWFGVKVFSDTLSGEPKGPDFAELLSLELRASHQDPYRASARLLHVVARRD